MSSLNVRDVQSEALMIAKHQGMDIRHLQPALDDLTPHLATYAELVITKNGLEILTGTYGDVNALATIALKHGALPEAVDAYVKCSQAFPEKEKALKICFGSDANKPSMYIRTKAPMRDGLSFLESLSVLESIFTSVQKLLQRHETMYYIAFTSRGEENALCLKTYHIGNTTTLKDQKKCGQDELGFVSYRVTTASVEPETKHHATHVAWDDVMVRDERWKEILHFAEHIMGYKEMSYFGVVKRPAQPDELKLYVERIGAIPTDYDAR